MISIEEAVNRILSTRRITRYDQRLIMALYSDRQLSDTDHDLLNRVYDALMQGRLRVVEWRLNDRQRFNFGLVIVQVYLFPKLVGSASYRILQQSDRLELRLESAGWSESAL